MIILYYLCRWVLSALAAAGLFVTFHLPIFGNGFAVGAVGRTQQMGGALRLPHPVTENTCFSSLHQEYINIYNFRLYDLIYTIPSLA
jgi:hypothetical protein